MRGFKRKVYLFISSWSGGKDRKGSKKQRQTLVSG